jgi:hypothetical protein
LLVLNKDNLLDLSDLEYRIDEGASSFSAGPWPADRPVVFVRADDKLFSTRTLVEAFAEMLALPIVGVRLVSKTGVVRDGILSDGDWVPDFGEEPEEMRGQNLAEFLIAEVTLGLFDTPEPGALASTWLHFFGGLEIPYKASGRALQRFELAQAIKPSIERWQMLLSQGWFTRG